MASESPPKKKHKKEDFELGQLLGGGAFAKVVEGTIITKDSPQYGRKYAIKVMDKKHIMKNKKIKYVTIEKKVFLATASHPFICHLHFTFQDSYSLFMVLDLCNDAELSYQIWKYCGLTEEVTRFYLSEVISCLEFMHSKGIYHRDIKPENVLLHADGHIRLTDFGTAKITDGSESKEEDKGGGRERKGSFVGTAQYVSPELLNKDSDMSYGGMDFWALGILIYQCLCDKTPFFAPNEYLTFKKIEEHSYSIPDHVSAQAKSVIDAFLTQDFTQRLGMKGYHQIKEHPFFASIESWEWEDMQQVQCPKYPATPKHSPVHNEDKKKELRGSVFADDLTASVSVPLDVNISHNPQPIESALSVPVSEQDKNEVANKKWKKFLNEKETIVMGSTVEKTKYFGMQTEKSVMVLTNMNRLLLIDPIKFELRKNGDIPRSAIVSCTVIDKDTFELRFPKSKMKFKCTGPSATKWKNAFEKAV
eukprot:1169101_1